METLNRAVNPAVRIFGLALGIVAMAGCATSQQSAPLGADNAMRTQFEQRIKQKESEIDSLKVSLTEAQTSLAMTTAEAESESTTAPLLPPNAKAGECYARVLVPPRYETSTEQMLKTAASTRIETNPAQFETVTVRNVVTPARSRTVEIPATYQTVTGRKLVKDGYLEWRSILCETNMTREVITAMQSALTREGEYTGPLDGIVGPATVTAVNTYQRKHSLPSGGITLEMLKRLKVSI